MPSLVCPELQDALDQDADDHEAELHEAEFHEALVFAAEDQLAASKIVPPLSGSVTTYAFRPAFGLGGALVEPARLRRRAPERPL